MIADIITELNRRKQQSAKILADKSKQLIKEQMSEEAVFAMTYVPYVVAEVAWEYTETIMNLTSLLKIKEVRRLCQAIKQLRKDYDYKRFKVINSDWRKGETDNMVLLQDELSDFFSRAHNEFNAAIKKEYGDIQLDYVYILSAVYGCRIVLKALFLYEDAQRKVLSDIIGYGVGKFLPDELRKLYRIVEEFYGDRPMPKEYKQTYENHAKELSEYINCICLNNRNGNTN